MAKSFLSYSNNLSLADTQRICHIMRIAHASGPSNYLGLPLVLSKSKTDVFSELKEKVQRRVASWKAKNLSQAGRPVLIKAVASAMPSYVMSMFLLPKGLCRSIDGIFKNFWWGFPEDHRNIFTPKLSEIFANPKLLVA